MAWQRVCLLHLCASVALLDCGVLSCAVSCCGAWCSVLKHGRKVNFVHCFVSAAGSLLAIELNAPPPPFPPLGPYACAHLRLTLMSVDLLRQSH